MKTQTKYYVVKDSSISPSCQILSEKELLVRFNCESVEEVMNKRTNSRRIMLYK